MLPIYHRQYDAKLIILAIPAMAILWARRGGVAWLGLLVTSAAFVLNGDIPWAIFLSLAERLHLSTNAPHGRLLLAAWIFPVPLSLMAMGAFYLWVLTQSSRRSETPNQPAPCEDAPAATA
jgi:hypothetical protein